VIELLVNLPSPHLGAPTRPFTPEVLQTKERTPTIFSSTIDTFGFEVSTSKSLGCVITPTKLENRWSKYSHHQHFNQVAQIGWI
jgi:hypothetical protein